MTLWNNNRNKAIYSGFVVEKLNVLINKKWNTKAGNLFQLLYFQCGINVTYKIIRKAQWHTSRIEKHVPNVGPIDRHFDTMINKYSRSLKNPSKMSTDILPVTDMKSGISVYRAANSSPLFS